MMIKRMSSSISWLGTLAIQFAPMRAYAHTRERAARGVGLLTKRQRRRVVGKTPSATWWLRRHFKDPFVAQAHADNLRSRAALKLRQLDERLHLLHTTDVVIDLGAAPGGWTQVVAEKVVQGRVLAVDILQMKPLDGVTFLQADVREKDLGNRIVCELGDWADVVLSDAAPNATGQRSVDHKRQIEVCNAVLDITQEVLREGGACVMKITRGGQEGEIHSRMRTHFRLVRCVKPPASRSESAEIYFCGLHFKKDGI